MGFFSKKSKESAGGATAPVHDWLGEGDALRTERKYEEALECYAKALELDASNDKAWHHEAQAMAMCFRYADAVEACEKALEINSSNAEAWFLKGFAFQMLGKYEEALESCVQGLDRDPGNQVAWCTKGEYLYALGKLEGALESFGTALKLDPGSEYAKDIRGKIDKWLQREGTDDASVSTLLAFLERHRHEDALGSYKDALEMDPRHTAVSFNKDFALAHLEQSEEILEDYEREKREQQPKIRMELSQKDLQFGNWSWVEATLFNEGRSLATDITFEFPPEFKVKHLEVDPDVLAQSSEDNTIDTEIILKLEPGAQKIRLLSMMPLKVGYSPLDVKIKYTGPWRTQHETLNTVWVNVFRVADRLPMIPGYAVLWRLSSGDSEDVYSATRDKDGLTVVIKIPRLAPDQSALAAEFLREVKQWSQLKHPNIAGVLQYGDKPFPWVALEYMEEGSLRRAIGRLSVREALEIGMKLAEALSYAGSFLITHRDIRPENVMLDSRRVPKLTNWRMKGVMLKPSQGGKGSRDALAYSAPEGISLDFGGTDVRTDIYQLGVLLYEMLTGKTPFQGEGEVLIEKVMQEQPRRPSELNPAISKHMDAVVLKCLAKHKEERYQGALALKADLARLIEIHSSENGASLSPRPTATGL